MLRFHRQLWLTIFLTALLVPGATAETIPPAASVVERLHDAFISVMKDADSLGYQGRFDELESAIAGAYDFDFMARKVVGRYWKEMSEQERLRWRALFETYTVASYAGRLETYTGETFETIGEEPSAHDTVVVQTRLEIPDDEDMEFNYRLRQSGGGWRIIDVYMNGTVSELALRRSDYSSVLKRDGFAKLETSVSQKIAELREQGGDDAKPVSASGQ